MYIGITFNKRILNKMAISNFIEMLFEIAFWNKIHQAAWQPAWWELFKTLIYWSDYDY